MDSRTSTAAVNYNTPVQGELNLATALESRQANNYDVKLDHSSSSSGTQQDVDYCCDNNLFNHHQQRIPIAAAAPLPWSSTTNFNDMALDDKDTSHVSPSTDSVAKSPLDESQVSAAKKSLLVKSVTCCDFYCSCDERPHREEDDDDEVGAPPPQPQSKPIPIRRATERVLQRKKLFPSFSHPDTSFIFTDDPITGRSSIEAAAASPTLSSYNGRRNWRRRSPDLELSWPLSTSTKDIVSVDKRRISVFRSSSEQQLKDPLSGDRNGADNYTIIPVHPEISIRVRTEPEAGGVNHRLVSSPTAAAAVCPLKIETSESAEVKTREEKSGGPKNVPDPAAETKRVCGDERDESQVLVAAQKFFLESGILGPVVAMGNSVFRKSSKVHIIDNLQFEQIRKHSRTIQKSTTGGVGGVAGFGDKKPKNVQRSEQSGAAVDSKCGEELSNLRELLKLRDNEIVRLKREIHKLKSVLQQTSTEAPIESDLISRIQTPASDLHGSNKTNNGHDPRGLAVAPLTIPPPAPTNPVAMKKQGVSAESSENKQQMLKDFTIQTHEKDFKSKQLIKDAILDNDFLKHLASSQIKELVESMYQKEIGQGEYVIREGESGAHLYIAAEGDFEVIKDHVILGRMGPGKAFGELAILYNCKRTASIRVLTDSKVWVLDRRVFQQIMMRTGMQRIEENVAFLRSVPLLKDLSADTLAKIADVLEVEFYSTGTYIIRQDTSGDSFFLISQGSVAVTQRLPGTKIEEEIRNLGRGDYFGEQALIKEDKRTANIVALCPGVECLTLDRESFRKFIGDLDELHEIDYGDRDRALSFKENEKEALRFSNAQNQQLLHINLNDLEIVTTLGVGGFGRVELVRYCGALSRESNKLETYALKCLKKQHIVDTQQEEHVYNERSIMMSCDSKFICRLYRTYRDTKYVYMLMEACLGGEIWTILRNRGYFDEHSGQFIIGCVLEGFQYLHSRGIVFRDLKPENLLLDANGYVKLIDFGFAKYIGCSSKTWTFCGTPEYVAPEVILNKGHDRSVDYWALGILVFELLTGAPPFTSSDPMKTYNIILKNIMEFPSHMSKTAINLIKSLCRDVPAERLGYQRGGVQEIKKHKWFQGFDWDGLSVQTMQSPIVNAVESPIDTSNFDCFPDDVDVPPDELSGWDVDF